MNEGMHVSGSTPGHVSEVDTSCTYHVVVLHDFLLRLPVVASK